MKIIRVDNYDRGFITPVVVREGLSKIEAERIAEEMNSYESEFSEDYYMVVEDDYKIINPNY